MAPKLEGKIGGDASEFIDAAGKARDALGRFIKKGDKAAKSGRKLSRSFAKVGLALKNAGKAAGAAALRFGAVAVAAAAATTAAVAVKSINLAREQIAVERQLAAVIESTGSAANVTAAELLAHAAALQKVTNFGDEVTIGAQAMLLTFTSIGRTVFPQATEAVLNVATAMKTGLKESATLVGKALNDPILGLTALTRVGITFTKAQKAQIKTLQETGKTMEAQKIILKELEVQFGGSARAIRDPLIQLKNAIGDVGEEIGKVLLPALDRAATDAMPVLKAASEDLVAGLSSLAKQFGGKDRNLLAGGIDIAASALRSIGTQMNDLAQPIGVVVASVSFVAKIIRANLLTAFALTATAVGLFVKAVTTIPVALGLLPQSVADSTDELLSFAKSLRESAFDAISSAASLDELNESYNSTVESVRGAARGVAGLGQKLSQLGEVARAPREEIEKLGSTIDFAADASKRLAVAAEKAADAERKLAEKAREAAEATKAAGLQSEFTAIARARGVSQMLKDMDATIARAGQARDMAIQASLAAGSADVNAAKAAFDATRKEIIETGVTAGEAAAETLAKIGTARAKLEATLGGISERVKENRNAIIEAFQSTVDGINGVAEQVAGGMTLFDQSVELLLNSTQEVSDAFERLTQEGGKDFNDQLVQLAKLVDDSPAGIQELADAVEILLNKEREAAEVATVLVQAQEALRQKQSELVTESLKLSAAFPEQTSAVEDLIQSYRDGEKSAEEFKAAMLALEKQSLATAAAAQQSSLIGRLRNEFGLGPKAAAAAARGGRASRGVKQAVAEAGQIQSRHFGGFLRRSGVFAGQRGEFVIKRGAAKAIGSQRLRAANNLTVNNTINASDRSTMGTRAQIRAMLPELRRQTKLGVLQGGAF